MLGMARLPSNASGTQRCLVRPLRRFDQITRGRFGQSGGILAGLRQFAFEVSNPLTEMLIFLNECLDDVFEGLFNHRDRGTQHQDVVNYNLTFFSVMSYPREQLQNTDSKKKMLLKPSVFRSCP
jgi:hypothetical protein